MSLPQHKCRRPSAYVTYDFAYPLNGAVKRRHAFRLQPYVMAVTSKQSVCIGFEKKAAKTFLPLLQPEAWKTLSADAGTKGPRLFDWAALRLNHPYDPARWQRFLLLRRSRSKEEEITFYLAFAPAGTPLEELARVAGRRWAMEESFAQTKGEVGLDQYEVRSWIGWHRHMTLAMTAQALLAITRARLFAKPAASQETLAAFKKAAACCQPTRKAQCRRGAAVSSSPCSGARVSSLSMCCTGQTGEDAIKPSPCSSTTKPATPSLIYNCNTKVQNLVVRTPQDVCP
jgi:hypothetical protein